jgi:large subunit ribosomal protein L4
MRKAALLGALTDAAQSGKLALVKGLEFDEPSTKDAVAVLDALSLGDGRTLLVLPEPERVTELSFRNLPHAKVTYSKSLSVYDVVAADHVLFTTAALDILEGKEPSDSLPGGSAPSSRARSARSSEPPVRESADSSLENEEDES